MGEHTPGPWRLVENPTGGAFVETNKVAIADVKSRGGVPHPVQAHCMANARLIAAAPDLLRACKTAVTTLSVAIAAGLHEWSKEAIKKAVRNHVDIKALTAAIAKAEGRDND